MKKRNTSKTRRLWTKHFGPIPKDESGRSHEIHHIDGNPENDSLDNLKCVSIQEHYDIHYSQGDWQACHYMAKRVGKSPEEISILGSLSQKKLVENGTHNFLDGEIQRESNRRRWEEGTHHFIGLNEKRMAEGIHQFIGLNEKRITEGTHNWLGPENNRKKIEEGTHNWIQLWTCQFCGKNGKNLSLFKRWGHDTGKCLGPKEFIPKNADNTVYHWKNIKTGELFATRVELSRKYNLRPSDIYNVITGRKRPPKGGL
jgi:hypothetical protein